jgi:hypothetical protein
MMVEADKKVKEMSAELALHVVRSETKELVTKAEGGKKELVIMVEADKKVKEMSAELALLRSEMERKEMRNQIRELKLRVTTADAQTAAQQQQHEMEPLKWEVRPGQMEQQLAMRPYYTQPIISGTPFQHMINQQSSDCASSCRS